MVEPTNIVDWTTVAIKVKNELTGKVFPEELVKKLDEHIKAAG